MVVEVMAVAESSAVAAAAAEEAAQARRRENELGANVRHASKISAIGRRATRFA